MQLLLVFAVFATLHGAHGLIIESVELQISITTDRHLQRSKLAVKNDKSSEETVFTACATDEEMRNTAAIESFQVNEANMEDKSGSMKLLGPSEVRSPAGTSCFDFEFAKPLKKGESANLITLMVTTNMMKPLPSKKKQLEPQLVVSTLTQHLVSPYTIQSENSSVLLPTSNVKSQDAPAPTKQEDTTLKLGPYNKLKPFSSDIFSVHVENETPLLHATMATREIDVSHWGTIRVRESYNIHNLGAEIEGEWSRLDMMLKENSAKSGAALNFRGRIPLSSYDLTFRDDIGNISTSISTITKDSRMVLLEPRYPIFGGWSTKFKFEYTLPLSSSVFKGSDNQYVLQVLSLPTIMDVTYDQLEMRILLPEGAKLVGESGIKPEYERTVSNEFTYFDFLGRPVVSLSMKNMIPEAAEYLKVEYTYSSMLRYQKHVVVALALLVIAVTVQLASQIDLGSGAKQKAA